MLIDIVIDNREQAPWHFPEHVARTHWGTLKEGDYAILGDQEGFTIERKSMDDFVGTISSGWDRFLRELERMRVRNFPARVIIVEGDYDWCCFRTKVKDFSEVEDGELIPPNHNHPCVQPQFIQKRIAELTMMQVHVLFAGDPYLAAGLAFSIFKQRYNTLQAGKQ